MRTALRIVFLASLLSSCSLAFAAPEDICPGGSSPRSDIQACLDFESLSHCTTGQEAQCQSDNGISLFVANSDGFKIKTCPGGAAVGSGCIYGSGKASGTGPGYSSKAITGSPTALNTRFYVKFGTGYMLNQSSTGNHGPVLLYTNGAGCTGYVSPDWAADSFRITVELSGNVCGAYTLSANGTFNFSINVPGQTFRPSPGKWYLFEYRAILNTTATGVDGRDGNGTLEAWVDGTKIISYTNVNFRGTASSVFTEWWLARSLFGLGVPRTKPNLFYDAGVLSTNGTYIGPSTSANSLGTADVEGPYWLGSGGDGMEQMKLASDCSSTGSATHYVSGGWSDPWGNVASFVTAGSGNPTPTNHYACDSVSCPSCTTSSSMKVTTTGANQRAGIDYPLYGVTALDSRVHLHGYVYAPGSNSYSSPFPFSGFARYCGGSGGGSDHCYAGFGVSGGNLAIFLKKDNVTGTAHTTAVPLVPDTWHEFEIYLTSAGKLGLYWDGTWIIDNVTANQDITWIFDHISAGVQFGVLGIISDSPAGTTTLWYDDVDAGGASFVDCTGWGASCPFGSPTTTTSTTTTTTLPAFRGGYMMYYQ